MDIIEAKLAAWTAAYEKLKDVRARYKVAEAVPGPVPVPLKDELRECERQCGVALDELNAEYAKAKSDPPDAG